MVYPSSAGTIFFIGWADSTGGWVDSIRQVDVDLALLEPMSATVVFLGGQILEGKCWIPSRRLRHCGVDPFIVIAAHAFQPFQLSSPQHV